MAQKASTPGTPPVIVTPRAESTTFTARPSLNAFQPPSYGSTDASASRISLTDGIAITVDRPTTPQVSAHGYSSTPGRRAVSFIAPVHVTHSSLPSFRTKFDLFVGQFISFFISSFFLSLVVAWASLARLSAELPRWLRPVKPATFPWDNPDYYKKEKVVKDVQSYARAVGFDILDEQVETADGYYLR